MIDDPPVTDDDRRRWVEHELLFRAHLLEHRRITQREYEEETAHLRSLLLPAD